ncbi:50S ribosomal protein L20 [Thecamonas trahens ATCC 50062]|uniref:50S ribosomal protein L20 n=1 Tax=Thecamonas trahens ATCC 50062 TaxID=461836 RepID=A0A0L0DRD4_THETB|nr:50S ribosomal protein L20 [Thecamonas trahens ATCC 50062]KNC54817.1 50S ribosomal protein L20 [Thecamonas trahens ATCC 50062]|eukprot:XP_013761716.1 50S ribosomal protein L20 [Thecamonas trahens ATCC 50062]
MALAARGGGGGGSRTAATTAAKHRKVLKMTKGYYGRSKNTFRAARRRLDKAMQYAYRDRRTKKREFRKSWVRTVSAAAREHGVRYGELVHALDTAGVVLNRKILAELAVTEPASFAGLVDVVRPAVVDTRAAAVVKSTEANARERARRDARSKDAPVEEYTLDEVLDAVRAANQAAASG